MGRSPDYDLVVVTPTETLDNGKKHLFTRVGSAWINESGSISIQMVTMPGVSLRLFPNKGSYWTTKKKRKEEYGRREQQDTESDEQ